MDNKTPWDDAAIAVRRSAATKAGPADANILYQGSLREVVQELRAHPEQSLERMRISLPDRGARPFHFDGHALQALLDKLPPSH